MFIFMTVTSFGPLTCSIITTTRKFFTILASVIIFQNPMSSRQWLGTSLVFVGLGLDSVYGKERKKAASWYQLLFRLLLTLISKVNLCKRRKLRKSEPRRQCLFIITHHSKWGKGRGYLAAVSYSIVFCSIF